MGSKPDWAEDIARERIDILFDEAADAFPERQDRADRYVAIARDIAMTFTLSLPDRHRRHVCSDCYSYIRPGANARVRVEDGVKRVTCEECGHTERTPLEDD
ncbi:MAG: ribonuclease P protein component 4 [Candidatus Nanohaloarchaea archaeon]|nr:ribonuclease P protein component 4 [Candidatus Nanohaloarchaea archaeon]